MSLSDNFINQFRNLFRRPQVKLLLICCRSHIFHFLSSLDPVYSFILISCRFFFLDSLRPLLPCENFEVGDRDVLSQNK
jgi:hypothetical protein